MDTRIQILDTGRNSVNGAQIYAQVNSGNWIPLSGFTLSGNFGVSSTNHASFQEADASNLSFLPNEAAALQAPRFTLRGIVPADDNATIQNIIKLQRSKGIKQLTGGLGLIDSLPEASTTSPVYIHVIIKTVDFSEVYASDKKNITFTIQLEQVI